MMAGSGVEARGESLSCSIDDRDTTIVFAIISNPQISAVRLQGDPRGLRAGVDVGPYFPGRRIDCGKLAGARHGNVERLSIRA